MRERGSRVSTAKSIPKNLELFASRLGVGKVRLATGGPYCMSESRSVNLVLSLPSQLADEVERVQRTNPELLVRVIEYGMIRRAVFDHLEGVFALHRSSAPSIEMT